MVTKNTRTARAAEDAAAEFSATVRDAVDLIASHEDFAQDWHLLAAFDSIQRAAIALAPESRPPAAALIFDRTRARVLAALTAYARHRLAAEPDPAPGLVEWRTARIARGVHEEYLQARLDLWKWLDSPTRTRPPSGLPTPLVKRAASHLDVSVSAAWRAWSEDHLSAGTREALASKRLVREVEALHAEVTATAKRNTAKPKKTAGGLPPLNFRKRALLK